MKLTDRRPQIRLALNKTEVAISIGVGVDAVDQMVAEGALPSPRLWHSRKRWLVSEIEAHLNEWPTEGRRRFGDRLPGKEEPPKTLDEWERRRNRRKNASKTAPEG